MLCSLLARDNGCVKSGFTTDDYFIDRPIIFI